MINRHRTAAVNWVDELDEIRAMGDELKTNWNIMTEYEQQVNKQELVKRREAAIGRICDGVVGGFKNQIRKYVQTGEEFDAEVRKEMNGWSSEKLNAETQLAETRVNAIIQDGDMVAKKLKDLYQEALTSQDAHRIRGVTEALKGKHTKLAGLDDKMLVNGLAKEAEAKVKEMRMTDGMKGAIEKRNAQREVLLRAKQEVIETSILMGQGDPTDLYATDGFAQAVRMVQRDPATGQVLIFREDSPEVTSNLTFAEKDFNKG